MQKIPFSGNGQLHCCCQASESGLIEILSELADSQMPWGVDALAGAVTDPALKTKPSYSLVATEDKMIPPPAQRAMAGRAKAQVTEVPGSHAIYVSRPEEVAEIIRQAVDASI